MRRRAWLIAGSVAAGLLLTIALTHLIPLNYLSVQQKPEQRPQQLHDYYIIMDEKTGAELMYVPLVVSIGDEVITEDNKRYTIVTIKQNRAYARYVEMVDIHPKRDKDRP